MIGCVRGLKLQVGLHYCSLTQVQAKFIQGSS